MPIFGIVKKICCVCLASLMLFASLPLLSVESDAVTPTYYVSNEYKSSKYYKALKDYKLTGDERYDLVSIALTQYGYHEGNDDSDMSGSNLEGFKNFAEYNRMYGKLDNGEGNGMSYGYSWCAAFVSWCLRQARVAESTIPTFVSCSRAVKDFRSRGMFKEAKSGYIPQTGDIIFFIKPEDAAQGYVSSHVGIVMGTDSGFVYTVEGNTDNYCVCQKSYPFDSEKLVGYATPNYKTLADTKYDFTYKTDQKLPGFYTVTNDVPVCREINVREDVIGQLKAGDRVEVKEVDLGWGLVDFGGVEGWIYLLYAEREQFTLTLDTNGGESPFSYHYKDAGVPLELATRIPHREGYSLIGWSSVKDGAIEYLSDSVYTADADATLYAIWRIEEYTVEFVDHDGRSISVGKYPYGNNIIIPEDPIRPADGEFTYEFVGWDKSVSEIARGNEVYRAVYNAVPIPVTTEAPETTAEPEVTTAPETTEEETVPPETEPETTIEETTAEITGETVGTSPQETEPEVTTEEAPLILEQDNGFVKYYYLLIAVIAIAIIFLCFKRKRDV